MKLNNNVLLVIGLFICLLMGCFLWYAQTKPNIDRVDTVFQTDTLRYVDTLTLFKEKPIPKEVIKIKTDTFYTKEGKDTTFKYENKHYIDTLCVQNDTAIIQNYISGLNANLDSTKVQLRKTREVITNTIEITKYIEKKKKFIDHFGIGPSVTGGYDVVNKQWGVVAGISVTYNF